MKIIIIGGVTAGMSAVSKIAGNSSPQVIVYEKAAICSCGTYGLPYYVANPGADLASAVGTMQEELKRSKVEVHCRHEVISIQPEKKSVTVCNLDTGTVFSDQYDKLVIASGSSNQMPAVPGAEKMGVQVLKTVEDVIFLREFIKTPYVHEVTIVGGSFAGLELAKAFLKRGRSVRIIEKDKQLLPTFDQEVSAMIQKELESRGITVHLGEQLVRLPGQTYVENVETNRGCYDTDLVMIAMGVTPNTGFLRGSNINMDPDGAVIINKEMETSLTDVYAVGDCTRNTGEMLRTASIKTADLEIARTGLTEREAKDRGFAVKVTLVTGNDRPGICPNANQITVKLVYDSRTKQILGAQAWGKKNVISRINMFAVAIESGMTPDQLAKVDFSYSSTASSIWDPVQVVCHDAR